MRLVSFSLYGSNPKYILGAYENANFVSNFMPGWKAVFYLGIEIEDEVIQKLIGLGAIVRKQEPSWHANGMFWRFKVFHDYNPECAIIRDTDSRISQREIKAVNEWLQSGKIFHIMRDHPHHNVRILGGMWGGRAELSHIIPQDCDLKHFTNERGQDQAFLGDYIYPKVRKQALVHDSFFWINLWSRKFPIANSEGEYVGESFDENSTYDRTLRQIRAQHAASFSKRIKLNGLYLKEHSLLIKKIIKFLKRL